MDSEKCPFEMIKHLIFICLCLSLFACKEEKQALPIIGEVEIVNGDTIYPRIDDIQLIDQDSQVFRLSQHSDKLIIGDFFFTSCPSICPKVQKQMLRLYDQYKTDDRILLLSHTIDIKNDSVTVLNRYAKNLEVDTKHWKFLTGVKDSVYHIADQYFVSVEEDPSAPKGFDHSGRIILLDQKRQVRGFCEGTDPRSVDGFFAIVDQLLAETYGK